MPSSHTWHGANTAPCLAYVPRTTARPGERLPACHGACRAPQGWQRPLQSPHGAWCRANLPLPHVARRWMGRNKAGAFRLPSLSGPGRCRPRGCRRGRGSESQGAHRPWPRLSDRLIPPGPAAQRPRASRRFLLTSARRVPADRIRSTCREESVAGASHTHTPDSLSRKRIHSHTHTYIHTYMRTCMHEIGRAHV